MHLPCPGPFDGIVVDIPSFVADKKILVVDGRAGVERIQGWANGNGGLLAHARNRPAFLLIAPPETRILFIKKRRGIP